MTTLPRERDTVGLFQVDGKWPNLALMHLASWIRGLGAMALRIGPLEQEICTIVYASKTFSFSRSDYIRDDAIRGGTGWDDWRSLPQLPYEAEHSYPAYDLWNCNEAMGFLTRGCIRRCPFCIVPDKEGPIRHHSHLSEWWRGQRRIRLLEWRRRRRSPALRSARAILTPWPSPARARLAWCSGCRLRTDGWRNCSESGPMRNTLCGDCWAARLYSATPCTTCCWRHGLFVRVMEDIGRRGRCAGRMSHET